jgi:hypothetical protein
VCLSARGRTAIRWRGKSFGCYKFGIEIDNRIKTIDDVNLITANCVKVFEVMDDLFPNLKFAFIPANPPFSRRWKLKDGTIVDSTKYTWHQATNRGTFGYFLANTATIEALGIDKHPYTYAYETRDGTDIWPGMRADLKIGIVWWKNSSATASLKSEAYDAWLKINEIVEQERISRPNFNIHLDTRGYLRTYLSIRSEFKLKLAKDQIARLHRINDCHPLTLTTEKETRDLMADLVRCGAYTIEPAARVAIEKALEECKALAVPVMPVTSFETVAYADEEETLQCIASAEGRFNLRAGVKYPIRTGSYRFADRFQRNKLHYSEETGQMYRSVHNCELSGTDRYIEVTDDGGRNIQFMYRPPKDLPGCYEEALLWNVNRSCWYIDEEGDIHTTSCQPRRS